MNHLFFERIDEVKNMQRKLWEIITSNQEDKPEIAVKCISELQKLSQSLCQMYEMLPLLGQLPSNAFAGIVNEEDINTNNGGGEVGEQDKDNDEQLSSSQESVITRSYVGGNSAAMYKLRRDID
jgi:hypothetical protein